MTECSLAVAKQGTKLIDRFIFASQDGFAGDVVVDGQSIKGGGVNKWLIRPMI